MGLLELSPIVGFQSFYLRKVLLVVGDQYSLDAFRMRGNHHIHRADRGAGSLQFGANYPILVRGLGIPACVWRTVAQTATGN